MIFSALLILHYLLANASFCLYCNKIVHFDKLGLNSVYLQQFILQVWVAVGTKIYSVLLLSCLTMSSQVEDVMAIIPLCNVSKYELENINTIMIEAILMVFVDFLILSFDIFFC